MKKPSPNQAGHNRSCNTPAAPVPPANRMAEAADDLQLATEFLRLCQINKEHADQMYADSLQSHEAARIAFNHEVAAAKSASVVPNPYAR